MNKKLSYTPVGGVCCKNIDIEVENNIVKSVSFTGGCMGNTHGVAALVAGLSVNETIDRLRGIDCKGKGTSCPDQLARALSSML